MLKNIVGHTFYVEQVGCVEPVHLIVECIYTPFSIPVPLRNLVLPRINFYDRVVATMLL